MLYTLPLKQLEMKGCVLSTVATDAIVLNSQAIRILRQKNIYAHMLTQIYRYISDNQTSENEIELKKRPSCPRVKSTGGSDR